MPPRASQRISALQLVEVAANDHRAVVPKTVRWVDGAAGNAARFATEKRAAHSQQDRRGAQRALQSTFVIDDVGRASKKGT